MATPHKDNGQTVRNLSADADLDLAQVKKILYEALTSGSTDPVEYVQAIGSALQHLEQAHVSVNEINRICELAAVRGPYKKNEGTS